MKEKKGRSCFVLQLRRKNQYFSYKWEGFKTGYYKQYKIPSSDRYQNYCFLMTLKEWLVSGTADKNISFLSQKRRKFSRYRDHCSTTEYSMITYLLEKHHHEPGLVFSSHTELYSLCKTHRSNERTIPNDTKSFDSHIRECRVLHKAIPRLYHKNAFVLSWSMREKAFLTYTTWLELFFPLSQLNSMQSYSYFIFWEAIFRMYCFAIRPYWWYLGSLEEKIGNWSWREGGRGMLVFQTKSAMILHTHTLGIQ